MKSYEIFTEDLGITGEEKIREVLLNNGIESFTLLSAKGVYKGGCEPSFVVKVVSEINLESMAVVCELIRVALHQKEVLLTWQDVEAYSIKGVGL